jgi:hypothetical protein
MAEFNDRMAVHRQIVQAVNRKFNLSEELFSLSSNAIERWLSSNFVDRNSEIVRLLYQASSKLFFLAAKSQEQVSDDYRVLSYEVESLLKSIESHCKT